MDRVKLGGYTELITAAYAVIPEPIHQLIQPHFLCGTNPIFAGLHRFNDASIGRSYENTWHVAYPMHQLGLRHQRHTTVVCTDTIDDAPWVRQRFGHYRPVAAMVHELGHVLDERLRFDHTASPVTRYARHNRREAFAEAFTAWLIPSYTAAYRSTDTIDAATMALFEHLADIG